VAERVEKLGGRGLMMGTISNDEAKGRRNADDVGRKELSRVVADITRKILERIARRRQTPPPIEP